MAHSFSAKLQGIENLTYKLWVDKLMDALFKNRWAAYKTKIAFSRANKMIEKIESGFTIDLDVEKNSPQADEHIDHAA